MTAALARQERKHCRPIRVKILFALLMMSLLPLIAYVAISGFGVGDVRQRVKTELIRDAQKNLVRLARDQASIANAMLDKVETETRMVAFFAQHLLNRPSAFGHVRSYSATERPKDPDAASVYTLAPGVSLATARAELRLTSNLDKVFALVRADDPILDRVYYGTQSGISRQSPWNAEDLAAPATTEAMDANAYRGYDPRTRPWYRAAAASKGVVWTKYANWGHGDKLFSLADQPVGTKVSAALAHAFATRQIGLIEDSPIAVTENDQWRLQDKNGKHYVIGREDGRLNVYGVDILTCSQAVRDARGKLAGVVGLDISMDAISKKIIHTPDEIPGYAFLLNERGELIEQEKTKMFIPETGSGIRQRMTAGATNIEFDPASASWVAYAPIHSIRSADGKSYWSLGISMPEAKITRLADEVQARMALFLELLVAILLVMVGVVIVAAFRVSKGITDPILKLDEGATRIGNGELDYRLDVRTGDEIEELATAFNKMANDLKTYIRNLKETTAEKERFESELRVAHEIQMSFLKKIFPPFPERGDFSLYATLEPAREVGGDLYDFGLLDKDRLVFYVGDVSDKGVPASLVMAMTMTLMKRASQQPGITPAQILHEVNAALAEDNENAMFVTLFIGIFDARSGELSFSNAGHNPPLILGVDGSCRYLTLPDGLVLGVMPEAKYADDSVHLEPGDMIVTYTDGVTEAMNPARSLYSEERLQQTLATLSGRDVQETVVGILDSVKAHAAGAPPSDDITVLALRRS